MPSGADESTPIGAACYGLLTKSSGKPVALNPISHLYLGKEYSDEEIEAFLKAKGCFEKYQIQKFAREFELEKKAAQLLAENHVVARFSGRSEFGARALGHRSILANPSSRDTVRVINEMIKNRDFWMPFASSILAEEASNYLEIPKSMEAPYMAITFNTTELAKEHLSAAIHPYDFTCRPQLVYKDWEPGYHALISEFKRITGIGGILNTSFNLHGEPNVETPEDAVRTLENSGLKYLCLGKFLIAKR